MQVIDNLWVPKDGTFADLVPKGDTFDKGSYQRVTTTASDAILITIDSC